MNFLEEGQSSISTYNIRNSTAGKKKKLRSSVFLCDVVSERKRMLITMGVLALDFACALLVRL